MRRVPVKTTQPTTELTTFIPEEKLPRRISNATLIDSILQAESHFIHISNDTDVLIQLKESDVIGTIVSE